MGLAWLGLARIDLARLVLAWLAVASFWALLLDLSLQWKLQLKTSEINWIITEQNEDSSEML